MDRVRILVVDDDEIWLKTVKRIVGNLYDLSLTGDPAEAVSLVRLASFSLAILDQNLSPDVSGRDLLKELRGIQPDLRCIILTGYAEVDDAVKSLQSGALDYLSKGRADVAKELRERIAKLLEGLPPEDALLTLLQAGESSGLEFKETVRWDTRLKRVNKDLETVITRVVAAFLNSELGGTLLIGVGDNGEVKGLQSDFFTLNKPNKDGYESYLITLLLGAYGKEISPLLRIDFPQVRGVEICRIFAKPSHRPVYVPDGSGGRDFYIRTGNSTRKLNTEEAIEYSKIRWKW
jgi:DNA-binding response OmpR family regulator